MTTQITTHNPVRSDYQDATTPRDGSHPGHAAPVNPAAQAVRPGRGWALAGVGAAITALVGTGAAWGLNAIYDPTTAGDADAIIDELAGSSTSMIVFHVLVSVSALLLGVFGVGLHRRLRSTLPEGHLAAPLAAFGLLGTGVVMVMATALDTEFIFAAADPDSVVAEVFVTYGHWVNTVPGCWLLVGLTGLAIFSAGRAGALPRWFGLVGLVLGGLTVLVGVAPLQYMAGATGALMLLVVSIGFVVGDREHRRAAA